ncbi:MAG: hypothetical protein EXS22_02095 [Pedosphaera sp.]|nr:hypothetical protein [Pedosphaera sp.]MSU42816.1 hypothetical protein [Pedosphaera sp.]
MLVSPERKTNSLQKVVQSSFRSAATPRQMWIAKPTRPRPPSAPVMPASSQSQPTSAAVGPLLTRLPHAVLLEKMQTDWPPTTDVQCLETLELPAIFAAFEHARAGRTRELMALDQSLAANTSWKEFTAASRELGRCGLQGLRPLRDERLLTRYAAAVTAGQSPGYHLVVLGLLLAVYAQSPRQGLLDYAQARAGAVAPTTRAAVAQLLA